MLPSGTNIKGTIGPLAGLIHLHLLDISDAELIGNLLPL